MTNIVWAVERLETVRPAVETMLPAQWAETGDPDFQHKPNWPFYTQLEKAGALVLIVMREDGRPIGYLCAMVHTHINATQVTVASIPTYYVEERPGRAVLLRSLWRAAKSVLADRGCYKATIEVRYGNPACDLLQLLGGKPVKVGYAFDLKEKSDA